VRVALAWSERRPDGEPMQQHEPPGPDFDDWLVDGERALQRTAHLLTGSVFAAQDLVQNTLARLFVRWERIRAADDLDTDALRTLVDEHRTAWRRPGRRGETLVEVPPDRPAPGSAAYDEHLETLWDRVCALSSRQRTVVVLRLFHELSVAGTADLMGVSVGTATSQYTRALASLETSEDLLTRTLREVTETTHYPFTWPSAVTARSRALAHARRRAVALVAAAVVVVGGSVVLLLNRDHAPAPSTPEVARSLADLRQGKAPQVSYLDGDAFVTAQGDRVTAPLLRGATTATAVGDGVLAAGRTTSQRPFATIDLVSGGSTHRLGCGTPTFALGTGEPAYWLSDGCRFLGPGRLVQGVTTIPTTKGVIYYPVATTSRGVVALGTVVLPQGAGSGGPVVIGPDGSLRRIPHVAALVAVVAVSPSGDLAVGNTARGYGVVTRLSTGAVQWRAPGTLGHFSASGRYVVSVQSVGVQTVEGVGDIVDVRDAVTGHLVSSTVLPGLSVVGRPVWEGDEAVLVVAEDRRHQQAIVRVGVDGDVARATPVAAPGEGTFRLAATP
jgi:RNA polymerase sigma factor (sigma-70 family)